MGGALSSISYTLSCRVLRQMYIFIFFIKKSLKTSKPYICSRRGWINVISRFHSFLQDTMAHRESRGIALLCFQTSALEECEGSASGSVRFLPPGKTRYPLYRRLGGPQGRSGRRKTSPHWDSIPGLSSPQSVAIPTELSGPRISVLSILIMLCAGQLGFSISCVGKSLFYSQNSRPSQQLTVPSVLWIPTLKGKIKLIVL